MKTKKKLGRKLAVLKQGLKKVIKMPFRKDGVKKPYKIRGVGSCSRYAVMAHNLNDLIKQGCTKLKFTEASLKCVCLESDGTEIDDDDYFQTLPPNEVLVLVTVGNTWQGFGVLKSHITNTLNIFREGNLNEEIREFFDQENSSELYQLMVEFANAQGANIDAETREDHPEWFQDLEHRYKTKSAVMHDRAKGRIRGYYSKTREVLFHNTKEDQSKRTVVDSLLDNFQSQLKKDRYHGIYFSRTAKDQRRLCNDKGWFSCQGAYDAANCGDYHVINPYGTKEHLVLFSQWNLDHVIEKSRTVLPSLSEAIQRCPANKEINWPYFYELLFTTRNLKLVDIRCHNKGRHSGVVRKDRIYRLKKR